MKIALGMSGGVDSSVCAAMLKEQGHDVTGVYLECWRAPGCRAEEDRKDAVAVALQLGIPVQILDFKNAYRQGVVEYFFAESSAGRTPNPDVMCNREIKFGLFYDWAMEHGFDAVATGHYAQVLTTRGGKRLARGADPIKDQSYFLYLMRAEQLEHIIFPIGDKKKSEVRKLALQYSLPVAKKPDSQGICFIGEINVHEFLRDRLGENPGDVVTADGEVIGQHKGLWFYTIGQRHGFELFGKSRSKHGEWRHIIPPFYVIAKRVSANQLVVGFGEETLRGELTVQNFHWIVDGDAEKVREMATACDLSSLCVRIRHGGALLEIERMAIGESGAVTIVLKHPQQGIAEGQSAVLYDDVVCLGGGVVY